MKSSESKKDITQTKKILVLIIFFSVTLFIGMLLINKGVGNKSENLKIAYSYNAFRDIQYKVNLHENSYYNENTLGMNKEYMLKLVKDIDIEYKYKMVSDEKMKIIYKYEIVADSNIRYSRTNDLIWNKQYIIVPQDTGEIENNIIEFEGNIKLDFDEYKKEIETFKSEFITIPINSKLETKIILSAEVYFEGFSEPIQCENLAEIVIPLNQDVFTITLNYEKEDRKTAYTKEIVEQSSNKPLIIVGGIIVAISLLEAIGIIRNIVKKGNKSNYEIAIKSVLSNYGDIIVKSTTPIEIEDMKNVVVKNFEQLVDIEEELRIPIIYYETIPGKESEFIIIYDNIVYRYIISEN